MVIVAQLCKYTKNHWMFSFKWVNCMVCASHLNKAVVLLKKKMHFEYYFPLVLICKPPPEANTLAATLPGRKEKQAPLLFFLGPSLSLSYSWGLCLVPCLHSSECHLPPVSLPMCVWLWGQLLPWLSSEASDCSTWGRLQLGVAENTDAPD